MHQKCHRATHPSGTPWVGILIKKKWKKAVPGNPGGVPSAFGQECKNFNIKDQSIENQTHPFYITQPI
jgi:hypothetical protein